MGACERGKHMIKIAFCDDDVSILNELRMLLDRYCADCSEEINYTAFDSPLELLHEIEGGTQYDILFLDIIMPGETGIDAAAEIRNYDKNVKIIFLTSSAEFAVQSYAVGAYFYLLKPICEDSFFGLMDSARSACEKEQNSSLIMRCKNGITRVELRKLEYCEVIHRTLLIHLTSGKVLESVGSLDDLESELEAHGGFLRVHRSYLVNLEYVQNLSYKGITMSCLTEIPIPRGKYKDIKNAFLEYAFQNRQVMI